MKILLVAVDAKFIHTNLAVRSLRAYSGEYKDHIHIAQFSINNTKEEILRGIYLEQPDVAAFSCYIWNISIILQIAENLKKVKPEVKVWLGGPEVSYNPEEYLDKYKEIDGIMIGEGERTFYELVRYYLGQDPDLSRIKGIAYRDSACIRVFGDNKDKNIGETGIDNEISGGEYKAVYSGIKNSCSGTEITVTSPREPLPLDEIPFPYEDISNLKNKIIYYESSRGCPYSCSYCLSSAHRGVRFRSMDLVKKELKIFLENRVPQVKFVDRTFNCNKKHAMEIWRFIKENDNGITNFHFEITADLLSEEELKLLETLRPGLVQFEIGVQTTNPETMKAIERKVDFGRLARNAERIRKARNIHRHLDLIAGLPLEDYRSFEKSFNDVYKLKPDQLQLGFLKVLRGSQIENDCKEYGIVCNNDPPYEVLFTNHISFDEILELKGICEMVEVYYNSGQFAYSMEYLEHFFASPMKMYLALYRYYDMNGLYTLEHSRLRRYEILLDFFKDMTRSGRELTPGETDEKSSGDIYEERSAETIEEAPIDEAAEKTDVFKEILLYDYCLRDGLKKRPDFSGLPVDSLEYKRICNELGVDRSKAHIEHFDYDPAESAKKGAGIKKGCIILFDYSYRDPITHSARTIRI